jgi:riboflavin biosynthesis pyrimidine reductase
MLSSATLPAPRRTDVVAARRPHVVVHVAVSLDGATTGFDPDVERFYELARMWREDVTLVGADTILAQEEALAAVPRPGPAADGPLLAVVDGRARVREWEALRDCGSWSGVLALRAGETPVDDGPRRLWRRRANSSQAPAASTSPRRSAPSGSARAPSWSGSTAADP